MGRGSADHKALLVPTGLSYWLLGTGPDQKNKRKQKSLPDNAVQALLTQFIRVWRPKHTVGIH